MSLTFDQFCQAGCNFILDTGDLMFHVRPPRDQLYHLELVRRVHHDGPVDVIAQLPAHTKIEIVGPDLLQFGLTARLRDQPEVYWDGPMRVIETDDLRHPLLTKLHSLTVLAQLVNRLQDVQRYRVCEFSIYTGVRTGPPDVHVLVKNRASARNVLADLTGLLRAEFARAPYHSASLELALEHRNLNRESRITMNYSNTRQPAPLTLYTGPSTLNQELVYANRAITQLVDLRAVPRTAI